MSAPIIALRPDGSGLPLHGDQRHANAIGAANTFLAQIGTIGTDGAARAEALTAFAGRHAADAAGKAEIRKGRWATRDAATSIASILLADQRLRQSPNAVRAAMDSARALCSGIAETGRASDAAFNPGSGGAMFPGLYGMLRAEMTPLPPSSFERIFPRVIPEQLSPGIVSYLGVRRTPVGNPAIGSGIARGGVPVLRVDTEQETRATAWLAIAAEQTFVQGLQAALPGQPVVGFGEHQTLMRKSMDYGINRLQWYGEPTAGMVGLLDDPAVIRRDITSVTLASNSDSVINEITDMIAGVLSAAAGLMLPDLCILSRSLVARLSKALKASSGIVGVSAIEFLQNSQLGKIFPGLRFEIADELDHIGGNGTSTTGVHGILLCRSDEMGIQRVPVLSPTMLPIVEGGVVQTAYLVAQIGRPWVSGLGFNTLITISES